MLYITFRVKTGKEEMDSYRSMLVRFTWNDVLRWDATADIYHWHGYRDGKDTEINLADRQIF
jgi:hypothetical protein